MKARWLSIPVSAWVILSAGQVLPQEALTGEALAQQSGCFDCHSVDKKVTGPPFRDVAAKYRGVDSARSALIEKVANGGKGNWTEISAGVPMPPHSPRLTDAEIQLLVDWVLSL